MSIRFINKIALSALLVVLTISTINAQTIKRANSPYSYFGIGDLEPTTFSMSKALGGLSTSLRSGVNINIDNPAALSAIKRTTFETGFDFNRIRLNNGTETQRMSDMGISYLAIAVPVTKFWGSSLGVLPYSSVYYGINQEVEQAEPVGTQTYESVGSGSLYQFYWANGFKFKNFSAGLHLAYIFGTTERSVLSLFPDLTNTLPNFSRTDNEFGGFTWHSGFQYTPNLTDRIKLTVGATFGSSTNINNTETYVLGPPNTNLGIIDTIAYRAREKSDLKLPSNFGFGISVNKGAEWLIGFDVKFANWGSTSLTDVNAEYTNTMKVSLAAAFVPYKEGMRNFINQTQYRVGAYYNNNYFNVLSVETNAFEAVNQFGVTVGAGFPLSKKRASRLNIAFDMGQRGTTKGGLLRETFFKANIGVTLNDLWFIKPKYD